MRGMSRNETATGTDDLSTAVIQAIADHEGVRAEDLERPLYDAIDPEALNRLFPSRENAPEPSPGTVSFSYNGYDVHVTSEGDVSVSDSGH